MTITEHAATLTALGICITCRAQDGHADWCPVPHVGFADGSECCGGCGRGLDAGEAYTAPVTDRLGTFAVADRLLCLPCGVASAVPS